MPDYRALYYYLFGQIASAVEELEQGKVILAIDRLTKAQREAEERVIGEE